MISAESPSIVNAVEGFCWKLRGIACEELVMRYFEQLTNADVAESEMRRIKRSFVGCFKNLAAPTSC